ncbi:MAG TPA: PRC-barrel domain-containing protein [Longimicrobiales bacterium]
MRAHKLYGPRPEEPEPLRPVPDLGGTPVEDAEGRFAGTLHGALAEEESGLIRYLDVALEGDRRHVLVPLGHARFDRERGGRPHVRLLAATRDELRKIPPYTEERPVGAAYGRRVTQAHGRLFHGERYYAHPAFDHRGLYAGEHPIIRGPAIPRALAPLEPMSALPGFEIAEGEPDIRRWPLHVEGRRIGTIDDLVVDPAEGKVRYAIVGIETEGRQVLLPVGYLRIGIDGDVVDAPALTEADVRALPTYTSPEPIGRDLEQRVRTTLDERLDGDGRHFRRPDYGPAGDRGATR